MMQELLSERLPAAQTFIRAILVVLTILQYLAPPVVAAPGKAPPAGPLKRSSVTLYGRVDELSYLCSAAGVKLADTTLPSTVTKIAIGSAAAYSGLREGDRVVRVSGEDNLVVMTIERAGKRYNAKIAVNVHGLKEEFESRKIPYAFAHSPFDKELKQINECEVVILLDRGESMNETRAGCPGDMSKWMWCKHQLDNLYLATSRVVESGYNLVLFNDRYQIRKGVTLWDLKQLLGQIKPSGLRKNISQPLEATLNDYFKSRTLNSKPTVVLVLTDGKENTGRPLQEVLIEASHKMDRPGELMVTFLQVGDSITGEELLDDLERNLVAKGARYGLVNYKSFSELRNRGLLSTLLDSVHHALMAHSVQ